MQQVKPSNYRSNPMGSVAQNSETETIARNIMVILAKNGDEFRELPFSEYSEIRKADGASDWEISNERSYFETAAPYCVSADVADSFCRGWCSVPAK